MPTAIQSKAEKEEAMDKEKRNGGEKMGEHVRTEFGIEFSGDMNAAKIYEILEKENKKRESDK